MADPVVPTDDAALDLIEESLRAALDDDGEIVGSEHTLHQLLEFWSGVDKGKRVLLHEFDNGTQVYEDPTPTLRHEDVIQALIVEVRNLRQTALDGGHVTFTIAPIDDGPIDYVGFAGKDRSVTPSMDLGRGGRPTPDWGLRRAVFDAAFGYVSGFRKRDILYYLATRSLSPRICEAVIAWENKRRQP